MGQNLDPELKVFAKSLKINKPAEYTNSATKPAAGQPIWGIWVV